MRFVWELISRYSVLPNTLFEHKDAAVRAAERDAGQKIVWTESARGHLMASVGLDDDHYTITRRPVR